MNGLLFAAAAGACGGAVGVGVAWLAARILGRRPQWLSIVPWVCIAIAISIVRIFQPAAGDDALRELDKTATVAAIKTHHPEDYARLAASVRRLAPSGAREDLNAAVSAVVTDVIRRERPKADEESSAALLGVSREQARALRDVDPAGCVAFMEGRGAPASLAKVWTAQMVARDLEASGRLLAQAATSPAPPAAPLTEVELLQLSRDAALRLPEADRGAVAAMLSEGREPASEAEHRSMCDFVLAVADVALDRPPAGSLVRRLWARP